MPSSISTTRPWPFWANRSQKLKTALADLDGFTATQSCLSADGKTGMAVDEGARRVCLIEVGSTHITRRLVGYDDLRACEVIEDGMVLASTAQAAKPAARRAASTPADLDAPVRLVALKLVLNDAPHSGEAPVHIVRFLQRRFQRGESTHAAALEAAQAWYRRITAYLSLVALRAPAAP